MTKPAGRMDNAAWRRARAAAIRDAGGICQLCGQPLDPDAPKTTAWATEVDHIVPLHIGGDPYALDNLRALHRWCHSKRGQPPPPRAPAPDEWIPPDPWVNCETCPNPCAYVGRPASRCW